MPSPPLVDLDRLAARLPATPVTRFAPSPTGALHLGHVVNAIYVWGVAQALGGRVLLRIEDHDRERSRPAYEAAILNDLDWLGLRPDAAPGVPAGSVVRQSDRSAVYQAALGRLRDGGAHIYACACSRRDIGHDGTPRVERPYPGTCRFRGLPDEGRVGLRIQLAPGTERFDDARLGPHEQDPAAQCGDLLLRDRVGQWTYQFAVTVDDTAQEIDLVVRGEDLLPSTGRQIRLARMLGRETPPVFLHHPLLYGARGVKLSKSIGDACVSGLRAAGVSPVEVLGLAASRAGLIPNSRPVRADAVAQLFLDATDRTWRT